MTLGKRFLFDPCHSDPGPAACGWSWLRNLLSLRFLSALRETLLLVPIQFPEWSVLPSRFHWRLQELSVEPSWHRSRFTSTVPNQRYRFSKNPRNSRFLSQDHPQKRLVLGRNDKGQKGHVYPKSLNIVTFSSAIMYKPSCSTT